MENTLIFSSEEEVRFGKLLKYIIPTYLTSLFNTVYTIIDGIFVSAYVGTDALAAINIVYPLVNVLTGIALAFATGGSAVAALHIGGGRKNRADRSFSGSIAASILLGSSFSLIIILNLSKILTLLGATDLTMADCKIYALWWLWAAPVVVGKELFTYFIRVDGSPTTFLRRPISINFVDKQRNEVWFLIQLIGDGTRQLGEAKAGDTVNVVLPLGNGFTMPEKASNKLLLVGGGVGTAPMLYLGEQLAKNGSRPTFLLGARSDKDLLQLEQFAAYGDVYTTTEDGSHGEKGYVTQHSILNKVQFEQIYTCGPKPMMMAVAKYARSKDIACEVSLENTMACGIGACLCCVENTTEGHLCVCKEGPVFNINKLLWQI